MDTFGRINLFSGLATFFTVIAQHDLFDPCTGDILTGIMLSALLFSMIGLIHSIFVYGPRSSSAASSNKS